MSDKELQAQPLKYKCKRCKGDRFRKEFETQVKWIDIAMYVSKWQYMLVSDNETHIKVMI